MNSATLWMGTQRVSILDIGKKSAEKVSTLVQVLAVSTSDQFTNLHVSSEERPFLGEPNIEYSLISYVSHSPLRI